MAAPLLPKAAWAGGTRPGKAKRILVLGGTVFLGPAVVDAALRRGHEVALFNRGKSNPGLYPELKKFKGDRDKGELDALRGEKFDAIVDTSGYVPGHVEATAKIFADVAEHYTFISSISVYKDFSNVQGTIDEDAELLTVSQEVIDSVKLIRESFPHYGAMKALCEQAAEKTMPGRVANIRPGLIVGPMDRSDRFTWWPVRVDRGGEVLAPGDPNALVQPIDVRDLGEWVVHCIENQVTGFYNACGFDGELSMEEFLHGCKCGTSTPVQFTWADEAFLKEQGVGPWMEMPMWLPEEGNTYVNNRRAIEQGLKFRPIADTIRDTLAWAKNERGDRPFNRTGIRPDKEKKVLAAFHERHKAAEEKSGS
ncbi:MAG: NAD-dependent epimerase/dehydratase family protein [Planctomycetota bacterium]|nr:MAG: NAD-dependent epimerase/dehydratase family protein [Planctomycetota bacterium]